MESAPAIEVEDLDKRYGREPVFRGLNLDIGRGEFFGLVGVNGAGKTTLIKCLLDLAHVDSGAIRIFGCDHRRARARARLAFLPEHFVPPYFATGQEFLDHMGRLHGRTRRPRSWEAALASVDFDAVALGKPVGQLSKGTAQKLGLAAMLLSGRELYVCDEPMGGLDPKARELLMRHLSGLKRTGQTLFFTTHQLADVSALCDRMAVLHGGELRYLGSPQSFCTRYGTATLEEAYLRCVTAAGAAS